MKMLTLNTQKAYQPGFENFFNRLLREGTYDFLLLQEATGHILAMAREASSDYEALNPFDPDFGEHTHVAILYKKGYILRDQLFLSFAQLGSGLPRRGWGFLGALFDMDGAQVFLGTAHLHPGIRKAARMGQIARIKEVVLGQNLTCPTIIGGDFNAGLPGEISDAEKILSLEFARVTRGLGPTLDSRYTERTPFAITKAANVLAKLGLAIKLKADHVYVDRETVQYGTLSVRLLLERVSDHLAIEVDIRFFGTYNAGIIQ